MILIKFAGFLWSIFLFFIGKLQWWIVPKSTIYGGQKSPWWSSCESKSSFSGSLYPQVPRFDVTYLYLQNVMFTYIPYFLKYPLYLLIVLQAHFSRLDLPISDYITDLKSVLDQSIRIIQAMIDICANSGWLSSALSCMHLLQMVMQVSSLIEIDDGHIHKS